MIRFFLIFFIFSVVSFPILILIEYPWIAIIYVAIIALFIIYRKSKK